VSIVRSNGYNSWLAFVLLRRPRTWQSLKLNKYQL